MISALTSSPCSAPENTARHSDGVSLHPMNTKGLPQQNSRDLGFVPELGGRRRSQRPISLWVDCWANCEPGPNKGRRQAARKGP